MVMQMQYRHCRYETRSVAPRRNERVETCDGALYRLRVALRTIGAGGHGPLPLYASRCRRVLFARFVGPVGKNTVSRARLMHPFIPM